MRTLITTLLVFLQLTSAAYAQPASRQELQAATPDVTHSLTSAKLSKCSARTGTAGSIALGTAGYVSDIWFASSGWAAGSISGGLEAKPSGDACYYICKACTSFGWPDACARCAECN
jgi:hypothetical protein